MRGAMVAVVFALASCVVVSEPTLPERGSSGETSSSGASTSSGADDSSTGVPGSEGGSIQPVPFPIYWGVRPSTLEPPPGAAGTFDRNAYVVSPVALGGYPGGIENGEALYESVREAIVASVPDPQAKGIGLLYNDYWAVAWCAAPESHQEGFSQSSYAEGLAPDAIPAAYEAESVAIFTALLSIARELRPGLRWGIQGLPRREYWPVVSEDPAEFNAWRDCSMLGPANLAVWDLVDFVAPRVPYFYPGLTDDTRDRNALYVQRYIETARIPGKEVIPVITGRYRGGSTSPDDLEYVDALLLERDTKPFVEAARAAGATGFVYALETEGAASTVHDYWMVAFDPAISALDEE